jgi:hypothetical protein
MQQEKKVLNYTEAMNVLNSGTAVRLPEWTGYWFKRDGKIKVQTRTGEIGETPNYDHYNMRNDWEIVKDGLGFDFALLALKSGKLVRRSGWNGSGQFVFIRPADSLEVEMIIDKVKSLPKSLKDYLQAGVDRLTGRIKYQQELNEEAKKSEVQPTEASEPTIQGVEFKTSDKIEFTAYFCLKNAQGKIVNGWVPSTGDLTATDWEIAD